MTALPTRKLEAFRYADIDALASVWPSLAPPVRVEIAAQQKLQQIWLPSGEEVDVRRVEMELEAGESGLKKLVRRVIPGIGMSGSSPATTGPQDTEA